MSLPIAVIIYLSGIGTCLIASYIFTLIVNPNELGIDINQEAKTFKKKLKTKKKGKKEPEAQAKKLTKKQAQAKLKKLFKE